jgi:hypothetical protein
VSSEHLTPAQQKLMDFLNELAVSDVTPELLQRGNEALDEAVAEHNQLSNSIHQTSRAIATAKKCAELEGAELEGKE